MCILEEQNVREVGGGKPGTSCCIGMGCQVIGFFIMWDVFVLILEHLQSRRRQ